MINFLSMLLALYLSSLVLVGCSSESSSSGSTPSDNTPPAGTPISGVVAAGAPLSGFVAIKDSTNTTVNTAIGTDGNYTADVANLTPPFVLFASGIAAGQAYTIASAATVDDIGSVVNITPLTDLIVGNVAGTDSVEFFNNPNFTVLTSANLDSAETDLRARLEPILTEAGVAADFDLLNTPFSANHNGLDGLLDVLDVVVDPDTESATISYVLDTNVNITEDMTTTVDATTIDVSSVDVTATVEANTKVAQLLNDFIALYASGTPTSNDLSPFIHNAFQHNGSNGTDFIAFLTSTNTADQEKLAVFIEQITDYAILDMLIMTTSTMIIKYGDGEEMKIIDSYDGGGWKMLGNQRSWGSSVFTETFIDPITNTRASSVSFSVSEDFGTWTTNHYLVATGPGLPANGVVLVQYALNDAAFGSESIGDIDARFVVSDADIATINNGDTYTLRLYNDVNGDTNIYPTNGGLANLTDAGTLTGTGDDTWTWTDTHFDILAIRPLLTTETALFATITAPTPADLLAFSSGTLDVTWTLPTGASSYEVIFDRLIDVGYERAVQKSVSDTATSVTLTVPVTDSPWIEVHSVTVNTRDEFNRVFAITVDSSM